jgi:TetR/AcrR family transcriptional regulator, tetracycline repressor protein
MMRRSKVFVPPRTRSLNREAVVTAALDLIDQDGLQAVTMRALANRLGVRAQSLYTHVASRQDLFDAIAKRIVDDIEDDRNVRYDVSDTWQDYLAGTARAVRQYAHRHPYAFVLLATEPADPHGQLLSRRWTATILAILERSGFRDHEAAFACRAFDAFLLGSLLRETRDPTTADHRDEDFTSALENFIDRITARLELRTYAASSYVEHDAPRTTD